MNKRLVIYTCITGNYDRLIQPSVVLADTEYVCFIPRGERHPGDAGIWKIEEFDKTSDNVILNSRFPKMMPHRLLPDCEYSLYIDANIDVVSSDFYDLLEQKIKMGTVFSASRHPINDCVYDEAKHVFRTGKDSLFHLLNVVHFLKSNHFPFHWGLYENNVLLRQHSNQAVKDTDELWWNLFQRYPKRDQLLLTYCLRKNNVEMDYLFPENVCNRDSGMLTFRKHLKASGKDKPGFLYRKWSTFPKLLLKFYISI